MMAFWLEVQRVTVVVFLACGYMRTDAGRTPTCEDSHGMTMAGFSVVPPHYYYALQDHGGGDSATGIPSGGWGGWMRVHGRFTPHKVGFAWNRLALLIIWEGSCMGGSSVQVC